MATSTATGASSREGTAKAAVADQISQAVQSTSNLLHLMQQSSASQVKYSPYIQSYESQGIRTFTRSLTVALSLIYK